MATGYTPQWKTNDGHKVIFPAENALFADYASAVEWKVAQGLFMIPFGLISDGVFEFEHEDGKCEIPHLTHKFGMLGEGCVVAGPALEKALAAERQ